jgi:hypothetical protein
MRTTHNTDRATMVQSKVWDAPGRGRDEERDPGAGEGEEDGDDDGEGDGVIE